MTEEKRIEELENQWIQQQQKKSNRAFMNLGFGTVAYFDIHFQLAVIYFIILLLAIPSLYLFAFYEDGNRHYMGLFHTITIGNLGFSRTFCKDTALAVDRLTLA